jgi:outer membrane protein OmpA-like peptidoglycan-associated protein
VSAEIDSLADAVEGTQERTRRIETRLTAVDDRARMAGQDADVAGLFALGAVRQAGLVGDRLATLDSSLKRMVLEVVLNEAADGFKFNSTELPGSVAKRLDDLVRILASRTVGAYFEIEGHTDSIGSAHINQQVGQARAEAVRRYLYERHHIALSRISVISCGADHPIASNETAAGRAENRRVVIRVLR